MVVDCSYVQNWRYDGVHVKLAHSRLGDQGDIFVTHIITIIKSEVSPFPSVVLFFHSCVSEVVVPSYAVGFIYYIPGKLGVLSFITVQYYDV